jgi:hypothetical protein
MFIAHAIKRVTPPSYRVLKRRWTLMGTPKKPSKAQLSKAGTALQNPHTREKNETKAAKTLAAGRKRKGQ